MENDNMPQMAPCSRCRQTYYSFAACTLGVYSIDVGGGVNFLCMHVFAHVCILWYPCVYSGLGTECVNSALNCANGRKQREDKTGTEVQKEGEVANGTT